MSESAVIFVRSATDDESGAESRRAQEQEGREYAQKNGLRIAKVWEAKGQSPLDSRRALRGFVEYVKTNPGVQTLLFQRPDRLSRRFRDLVELHDFCRKNGRELRFFGTNQSPQSDATMLEVSAAIYRGAIEARRDARKGKKPPTDCA